MKQLSKDILTNANWGENKAMFVVALCSLLPVHWLLPIVFRRISHLHHIALKLAQHSVWTTVIQMHKFALCLDSYTTRDGVRHAFKGTSQSCTLCDLWLLGQRFDLLDCRHPTIKCRMELWPQLQDGEGLIWKEKWEIVFESSRHQFGRTHDAIAHIMESFIQIWFAPDEPANRHAVGIAEVRW